VLTNKSGEKSLYGLLPGLRVELRVGEGTPEVVPIPMPEFAVFVLFNRNDGVEGEVDVLVDLEWIELTPVHNLGPLPIRMEPHQDHYQLVVELENAGFNVSSKPGHRKKTLGVKFSCDGVELGKAEFLLNVDVAARSEVGENAH